MCSVSVPDSSVPRRPDFFFPAGSLTRNEKRWLAAFVAFMIIIGILYSVGVNTFITKLNPEQINTATPMIVQLDSFLTGGWVIGFFHYWSNWEKAWRESKHTRIRLKSKDPSR